MFLIKAGAQVRRHLKALLVRYNQVVPATRLGHRQLNPVPQHDFSDMEDCWTLERSVKGRRNFLVGLTFFFFVPLLFLFLLYLVQFPLRSLFRWTEMSILQWSVFSPAGFYQRFLPAGFSHLLLYLNMCVIKWMFDCIKLFKFRINFAQFSDVSATLKDCGVINNINLFCLLY